MRRTIAFAAALLAATAAVAQSVADQALAPPVASIDERYDAALGMDPAERMTVPVHLDGHGPFPFIVDTGAERTVISRELADRLALAPAGSARVHSVTRSADVSLVRVDRLEIDKHRATDLRAPALAERHLGGAGMIGIDSLKRQRVVLDFRKKTMSIEPSAKRERVTGSGDDIIVTARSRHGRLVVMDAEVEGIKVAVILDTGSQISIGNEKLGALLKRRRPQRLQLPMIVHDVTGGAMTAEFLKARDVRVGAVGMRDLTIAVTRAPVFAELDLDERPAMLLGMDGMRPFQRVSIDFARRRARFLVPEGASGPQMLTRIAIAH